MWCATSLKAFVMRSAKKWCFAGSYLSASLEPLLIMLPREDFIAIDLISSSHHGMQGCLGMLTQHIPPQHKLQQH